MRSNTRLFERPAELQGRPSVRAELGQAVNPPATAEERALTTPQTTVLKGLHTRCYGGEEKGVLSVAVIPLRVRWSRCDIAESIANWNPW